MGFLDSLRKKAGEAKEKGGDKGEVQPSTENTKYGKETCSLCGGVGTEKKWMGQYWHRKCIRIAKKASKKMI